MHDAFRRREPGACVRCAKRPRLAPAATHGLLDRAVIVRGDDDAARTSHQRAKGLAGQLGSRSDHLGRDVLQPLEAEPALYRMAHPDEPGIGWNLQIMLQAETAKRV